jgi:oxepin-CoA hydrolase/3-oxo-5,6-dehydrosuberyl-CoA semialdehyde dehydrogenase
VGPDDEEFDLFAKEVAREMTVKAGQKCTAIRRAIVPRRHLDAMAARLRDRLAKDQRRRPGDRRRQDGRARLESAAGRRRRAARAACQGQRDRLRRRRRLRAERRGRRHGAFFAPTLVLCRDGTKNDAVHDVEAFGPVSTLMPYEDFDEAMTLAARGRGSLVATLVTHDPKVAAKAIPQMAAWHGRLLVLDRDRRGGIDGPRLALADAQARRPGPRRRRRGARRHPCRQALPAACGSAGIADDADRGDRRVRPRRDAPRRRCPSVPQALRGASRSATRC